MKRPWIVVLAVIALLVVWAISSYNGLVRANTAADNQWAQVQTEYQRRVDLIPNVVATVKGVSAQELAFVKAVTDARAGYNSATTPEQKVQAANNLESALGGIRIAVEANPAIQTTQAYRDLTVELEGTENRVSVERKRYNDAVTVYNLKVKTFPSKVFASIFGFASRTLFQSAPGSENAPAVDFNN